MITTCTTPYNRQVLSSPLAKQLTTELQNTLQQTSIMITPFQNNLQVLRSTDKYYNHHLHNTLKQTSSMITLAQHIINSKLSENIWAVVNVFINRETVFTAFIIITIYILIEKIKK
jgi:phenylpropionate dioxygenase-like ring-hydroxylating dioxygenase large terminal subunit